MSYTQQKTPESETAAAQAETSTNGRVEVVTRKVTEAELARNYEDNRRATPMFWSFSKFAVGIVLIILVNVIWVGSAVAIKGLYSSFSQPFFLTYFNTTGFCLWNFGYFTKAWRRLPWMHEDETNACGCIAAVFRFLSKVFCGACQDAQKVVEEELTECEPSAVVPSEEEAVMVNLADAQTDERMYSRYKVFICALQFCPLWFLANWLYNLSLAWTSVATNTILQATSSIWTLLAAFFFLHHRITVINIVAIAVCFGGSVMVGIAGQDGRDTVQGDIIALCSALMYAAYATTLNRCLPDEEKYYVGMVFGFVGVLNFFFLWPVFFIINYAGLEKFTWPQSTDWAYLVLNALIGTNLSDVIWAKSVVLTSPVVATLGLTLSTPLSLLADYIFYHMTYDGLYIAGAVVTVAGFFLATAPIPVPNWAKFYFDNCCCWRKPILEEAEAGLQKEGTVIQEGSRENPQAEPVKPVNEV